MALYGVGLFTVAGDAAVKLCPCHSQQWMGFIGLVQEGLARKRMHALIVPAWTHGCKWSASVLTHKLFGDLWHFFAHFAADQESLKNSRGKLQSVHEKGPSSEKEKRSVRRWGVRWCRRRLHAFLRLSRCPDNVTAFPCSHLVLLRRRSRGSLLQEDVE